MDKKKVYEEKTEDICKRWKRESAHVYYGLVYVEERGKDER
jgi:hypothetical protein